LGVKQDLVFKIAKRWISGKDLSGGIQGAKEANRLGLGAIMNYLGEDVTDLGVAQRGVDEYLALQRAIHEQEVDGCASVKLTQLGLVVDESFLEERIEEIANNAESLNQFLWIDMESSRFTAKTIDVYLHLLEKHRRVGVALQAYMRRCEQDMAMLLEKGAIIRLVKGAYRESPDVVFTSREEIRKNFSRLMRVLFERASDFAIGTHDSILVDEARTLSQGHNVKFEFEMLKGIRDDLKPELVASGYRVVEYVPYGDEWYPYSMRRLKEHPSNIWLLLRSIV